MKKAFTLAEVLITLGIIGVVAAMTMPAIIAKNNKTVVESKLKKMYSTFSQSLLFAAGELGGLDSVEFRDGNDALTEEMFYNYLKKYMKITKKCTNQTGCWVQVKNLRGSSEGSERGIGSNIITFTTVDGISVCMDGKNSSDMTANYGIKTDKDALLFYIDVNGFKNPNVIGKDVFLFGFTDKGLMPAGKDKTDEEISASCSKGGNGYFCAAKAMRNGWRLGDESL